MSQNSKTAKMVLGRYYRVLNSRLALTRLCLSLPHLTRTNINHDKILNDGLDGQQELCCYMKAACKLT